MRQAAKLVLFGALFSIVLFPSVAQSEIPRQISVRGEAEIRVVPDEVVLTVGVETDDHDLDKAKDANDAVFKVLLKITDSYGIPRQHVGTEYLDVEPRYRASSGGREFLGYWVQKTAVITLRDIKRFEPLLSSLLEAGVTHVHGIDFRTTELRKHRDRVRHMAVKAAREKADALAASLGVRAGRPLNINEGSMGWYSGYGYWGSGRRGMMSQNIMQEIGSGSPSMQGPTAPGQISINAVVSVSFELL